MHVYYFYFNSFASSQSHRPNPSPSIGLLSFMELTARSQIDTSRPFQSVREAVEVFGGERCAVSRASSGGSSSSKFSVPPASPGSSTLLGCLKKLEEELAEARSELVQLRQRQSQMEMAVSSITVQLRDGLAGVLSSDLKKGKELAVAVTTDASSAAAMIGAEDEDGDDGGRVRSDRWDETRAEEWMASLEYLPSLSEALAIKMIEQDLGEIRRKVKSKKAKKKQHKKQKRSAVSLVGGIFSRKDKSR